MITILIPCYNEELNIPELYNELVKLANNDIEPTTKDPGLKIPDMREYDWEFLFVNDGSTDGTLKMLRKLRTKDSRVSIVNLSRNFGKENAMLAGMDYAKGEAVIIFDADLQHPLSSIPEMIYWWQQGYEDVYGVRRTRGNESWLRKKLTLAYYSLLQGTTQIEILRNVGDFRLLDRRVVNAICTLRETQRYTKGLYCWVGYNKKEIVFDQQDRTKGKSSFSLKGLTNLAIEGITCYTTSPLRISTICGLIASFFSMVYLIFIIIKTLIWGEDVQGFPTLMCVILFMGGLQLISIGIIGEYIGRIFNETKHRPPYIVESYNEEKC